jgi:hypothetical protein
MSRWNRQDSLRANGSSGHDGLTPGRQWLVLAVLLALCAALVPPEGTAAALSRVSGAAVGALVLGVWCLKGALLLLGAAAVVAPRWLPVRSWSPSPQSVAPTSPAATATVLALLLVGAVLRLRALGEGLWLDEIDTLLDYVRMPLGYILTTIHSQNQHLLYSALAHVADGTISNEAAALRLPAALFGVASLWAVWRFGRSVASTGEAILATALLTVSYHHVWFSQNGRGYTGLLFFTLMGTTCLVRLLAAGASNAPRRDALLYALWMSLAMYIHVTAALIVVAHAVVIGFVLVRDPRARSRDRTAPMLTAPLLAALGAFALYAIVLPQLVSALLRAPAEGASAGIAWKSTSWLMVETVRALGTALPGGLITVGFAAVVLLAGVVSYWRQQPALLLVMVLPVLLTAAAVVGMHHNLWPRFFFFGAGFAVLLAVRGGLVFCRKLLGDSRGTSLAWVGGAAMVIASAFTVPRAWAPKQDIEGAAAWIDASRRPGDVVVATDLAYEMSSRYLHRDWPVARSGAELASLESPAARTWVLYTLPVRLRAHEPDLWARLERDYREAGRFSGTVSGGDIVILMRELQAPSSPDSIAP